MRSLEVAVVALLLLATSCISSMQQPSHEGSVVSVHRSVTFQGEPIVEITVGVETFNGYEQYTGEYPALSREAVMFGHEGTCVRVQAQRLIPCER